MNKEGNQLVQAISWIKAQYQVSSGTYVGVVALSCLEDGDATAHFGEGDETITFVAGSDVSLGSVDVTIVSGSFAVN